eukprot:GHVR01191962.1.p1 GENE.GHVR01191962.1~~GHVR01191962.1.p1  ORF type:complete len:666 (+),score=161.80 GHVR01191962.1:194-1999(+)
MSLFDSSSCLIIDDEFNRLEACQNLSITPIEVDKTAEKPSEIALKEIKEKWEGNEIGTSLYDYCDLINKAKTCDQANTVIGLIKILKEKGLKTTATVTAGRGRGKSASLGLVIAASVHIGYSNIFITAPVVENVSTVFEFVIIGLKLLGYKEHHDFDVFKSESLGVGSDYNKQQQQQQHRQGDIDSNNFNNDVIIRINIFKENIRKTVQYIQPQHYKYLNQAELLIIDEAAAIPLPMVRRLMGAYCVFLSTTVSGYEGTGRALSLKLVKDLEKKQNAGGSRMLEKFVLKDPIRYSSDDPLESWLHLLCLDATEQCLSRDGLSVPNDCTLYQVDRNVLFSSDPLSESFLKACVSLFVSSHYKNSPNDLLLMSDAPAHMVFVLLPPINNNIDTKNIPNILVSIQVSIEGRLSNQSISSNNNRGFKPSGDLIPWTIGQHFINDQFGILTGLRIVRIATHPSVQGMGYGGAAVIKLIQFLKKKDFTINTPTQTGTETNDKVCSLLTSVDDIETPPPVDYIGASFAVDVQLLHFWMKMGFKPVYMRQTQSETTGMHSAIVIRRIHEHTHTHTHTSRINTGLNSFGVISEIDLFHYYHYLSARSKQD